jgi:hypothetical protein
VGSVPAVAMLLESGHPRVEIGAVPGAFRVGVVDSLALVSDDTSSYGLGERETPWWPGSRMQRLAICQAGRANIVVGICEERYS